MKLKRRKPEGEMGQRVRRVRRDWREVVRLQEESGLNARAYCLQASIDPGSFYKWRGRIQKSALITRPTDKAHSAFIDIGRIGSATTGNPSCNARPLEITLDFGEGFTLTVRRG